MSISPPVTLRRHIAALATSAAIVGAGASAHTTRSPQPPGRTSVSQVVALRIDALVKQRFADCRLLNLAVVDHGKIVFTKAYGEGRLNGEYEYGSVSKPVTSTILMQLRREGLIRSLDDAVWVYLPRYANAMPPAYRGTKLTLKHLLTHRSGVQHNDQPLMAGGKFNLKFSPGSEMLYSTPGYGLLGEVIQAVTGMSYSDAVRQYIGYPVSARSFRADASYIAPGAFVTSTIEDMARFAIGIIENRYMPADVLYQEVLRPETGTYACGWRVLNLDRDDLAASHGGSNGLPRAYVLVKPRLKQAVVVLAAMRAFRPLDLDALADEVLQALREPR